jgi:hypothetical protein
MGDKALAASGLVAVPDSHLKRRWRGLTTELVSPKRNGGSTMVRTMSFWTRESVFGCAESRQSRGAYARRQDVSVGTLARWEAEFESGKVDGTGMRLVEVEMVPMPTEERLGPEAADELVSSWYAQEGHVHGFSAGRDYADHFVVDSNNGKKALWTWRAPSCVRWCSS